MGWTNLERAKANAAHVACGELGRLGVVGEVITQSSFFSSLLLSIVKYGTKSG